MLARRRARLPAELSLRFDGIEELDAALDTASVTHRAPWEAGYENSLMATGPLT